MSMLFHQLLDASADRVPDAEAVRSGGVALDYARLHRRVERVAQGLRKLGVRRRDRVATFLPNAPHVIEVALACSRLGAISVLINSRLKARQVAHIVEDCTPRVIVTSASGASVLRQMSAGAAHPPHLVLCHLEGESEDAQDSPDALSYMELIAGDGMGVPTAPAIDCDAATIFYTSGSTGRPKGVTVSHRNLVSGAESVAQYLGSSSTDKVLAALPLSFDYGWNQVSTCLLTGACAVLTNYGLPAGLLREVAAEGITGLAGVPTMWTHLATLDWPDTAVRTLRYITNSGGALTPATSHLLQSRLPRTRIFCMYGLTEAFRSTYLDPAELHRRPDSIGKAIPNQEILVLRPDGSACDPGETGELVHRGSLVTLGYWNNEEATARRFRPLPAGVTGLSGEIAVWSGDLVRTDEDGFLYFVGRGDAMIKTSGHRVSPTEVEEVVSEVPGVVESAAFGLPDPALGQRICIAVVSRDGSAQLLEGIRRYCRRELPAFMVPSEVVLTDALPKLPNGKVDRVALPEVYATAERRPLGSPEG